MGRPEKLNIVIDSTHLRKDVGLNKEDMLYLKALSQNNLIKLHIPWIIYKECTTSTIDILNTEINSALVRIKGLTRKGLHQTEAEILDVFSDKLKAECEKVVKSVERVWNEYIKETNAELHPFKTEHSKTVFDNYFSAGKPFKSLKNRTDIPDAFIYETIKQIVSKKEVHFISEDTNLIEKISDEKNIKVYKEFKQLYDSGDFKYVKNEYEQIVKSEEIKVALLKRKEEIFSAINEYIDKLEPYEVTELNIPSDNGDATINAIDNPVIKILEDEIKFIDDFFYVPISIEADASIDYFIYKSDYFTMEDNRALSVSDWNEHYFLADEVVKLIIKQTLTISGSSVDPDSDLEIEFGEFEDEQVEYKE